MTEPILHISGLTKRFGALTAADRVDLDVKAGEIHALIGPNGAGKTTLLNLIAGELRPDGGRIFFRGRDITRMPVYKRARGGMARTFQITNIFNGFSALDNAALAVQAGDGHNFRFWKNARRLPKLREPARLALEQAGLSGERIHMKTSRLSHGEQRQAAIAMALASRPALMLLDEPMAGMGVRASKELVELLRSVKGSRAILLVEHDMDAVFSLADRISVLVYGRVIAAGPPETIRQDPEVLNAYLSRGDHQEESDAARRSH